MIDDIRHMFVAWPSSAPPSPVPQAAPTTGSRPGGPRPHSRDTPRAWSITMTDVTRRRVLQLGAAGAGAALAPWMAVGGAAAAAPPEVRAANDLALWYDRGAGTDWLRALPIGNG